ncbi:hypothetical protein Gasu2_45210 [Galdieria sulphuraria]|nr:hypothetical protein Gasu2_45210 [Galdieria sulphuraria]
MKRLQCLANSHSLPVVHISVIVAALNEAANISQVLQSVINEAKDPCAINEVVLVDAGSRDNTVDLAKKMASKSKVPIRIISSPERGRAFQFNWGVRYAASSNVFLFLHGDTILPKHYDETVRDTLLKPNTVAGAFSLGFRNSELAFWRSRFIPVFDQVSQVGWFPTSTFYGRCGNNKPIEASSSRTNKDSSS